MVKLNKIYTRTGDDGTTGLVDGSRVAKDAARMEAIGAVDEANSAIGLAVAALDDDDDHAGDLCRLQNDLFDLGADLATPGTDFTPGPTTLRIIVSQAAWLEQRIDALNQDLASLTSFILPGGSEAAARVHVARAAVRGAERSMVTLARAEPVNPSALKFINRLSDYLFVLSRALNARQGGDVMWMPGASREG